MIKWYGTEGKFTGFTYYPALEIAVGIFLLAAAFTVPALFVYYNGIKADNWGELLFCLCFFILFAFMGRSLTFQSLSVNKTEKGFSFYQNLREPPITFEMKEYDWEGLRTEEITQGEETFVVLILKIFEAEKEFYRSVNRKEINKIVAAMQTLHKGDKEEDEEE